MSSPNKCFHLNARIEHVAGFRDFLERILGYSLLARTDLMDERNTYLYGPNWNRRLAILVAEGLRSGGEASMIITGSKLDQPLMEILLKNHYLWTKEGQPGFGYVFFTDGYDRQWELLGRKTVGGLPFNGKR